MTVTNLHHRNDIPWHDKRVKISGWRKWFHRHQAHTSGFRNFDLIERCACGAIRSASRPTWVRL